MEVHRHIYSIYIYTHIERKMNQGGVQINHGEDAVIYFY